MGILDAFSPAGWIGSAVQGLASGIVGPITNVLIKKQDVTLDGFKTASGYDLEAFKVASDHELEMNRLKLQADSWWGPRLLYMVVGGSMALHASGVAIDSTFTFGTGHYGNLGIPPLPGVYATFEQWVVASLFVVSTLGKPLNAVAAWLGRK